MGAQGYKLGNRGGSTSDWAARLRGTFPAGSDISFSGPGTGSAVLGLGLDQSLKCTRETSRRDFSGGGHGRNRVKLRVHVRSTSTIGSDI